MQNIVDFRTGRARSRRSTSNPQDGAQILLFTGVRYVRETEAASPSFVPDVTPFDTGDLAASAAMETTSMASGTCLDLASH